MAGKAKVTNRYRYNTGKGVLTFFATDKDLLGVEINHSEDLDLEGPFLTKSNKRIEEAISAVHDYVSGETKDLKLPFASDEKAMNKKIKDALK